MEEQKETKYCKHCGKEIDDKEVFCKHCGSKINEAKNEDKNKEEDYKPNTKTKSITSIVVTLVIFAIIVGVAFTCCGGGCGGSGDSKSDKEEKEFSEVDAWVAAKIEVENNLKSPATAKFPWGYSDYVKKTDTDEYFVQAYVDSENSFGALVRTQFRCYVTHLGNLKYKVEDLHMWE